MTKNLFQKGLKNIYDKDCIISKLGKLATFLVKNVKMSLGQSHGAPKFMFLIDKLPTYLFQKCLKNIYDKDCVISKLG